MNRHDQKADDAIRFAMTVVQDNMTDPQYRSMAYDKLVEALLIVHASDIIKK